MESLVKLQLDTKTIIEKGRINFKKSPKDRLTRIYVETRLESLETQWKQFVETHRRIITKATDTDLKDDYFTSEIYDETEDVYLQYKSELKECTIEFIPCSNANVVGNTSNVKLPKITLPTFTGQYSEWISFRDLFLSLIHSNKTLDNVQKLHYLKSHLSGEAEQLLRHTPVTASNYSECWKILCQRYDSKKFLVNCMLKEFVNQPAVTKESSTHIKILLDTTVECLHGLRTLDIDVSSWDAIIIYLVIQKLDAESRKLWETRISTSDDLPTFNEFKTFMESRFRSLEYLDPKASKQSSVQCRNAKSFHVASQSCVLCTGDHKLCHCKQFAKKDCDQRREFARANKLCFNCLGKNHSVYTCRQSTKCHLCNKKHHSLLHIKTTASSTVPIESSVDGANIVVATATDSPNQSEITKPICCVADVHNHGLLATALVNVESRTGTAIVLRALMDQGSQVSFITEAAVQLLGLKKKSAHTDIFRLGDDKGNGIPSKWIVRFKLQSRLDPTFSLHVEAYVLNRLTSRLPDRKIVQVLPSFSSLKLADPSFNVPGDIDLLLSTRVVGEVLMEGLVKGPPGTPVAQRTKLGWILSGEIHTPTISKPVCCTVVERVDTNALLKKFWELESESSITKVMLTEEEQKCEDFYSKTTNRDATGRYVVKLPFKTEQPTCIFGGSEAIARKRFHMLEKRLMNNPELGMRYRAVINEYIQLGHEVVPQKDLGNNAVYLPHHAVVREDKSTTKVRVFFDASCSGYKGVSLNDDLLVGPILQLDLRKIIMRWRRHPICLLADIVKIYRQVKVCQEDADYQRILWRDHPDAELQHLRLLRVTFGTASAPYLAVRSLQQIARDEGNEFPLVSDRILKDFYVDDFLSGCESISEGEQIYHQMNELLSRGGFELQKWSSNSNDLLIQIKGGSSNTNLEFNTDKIMKILGLSWNGDTDTFRYTVHLPQLEAPITKRKVMSDIARLFDPLGWRTPVIKIAKVFIQQLWLAGSEWDDALPDHLLKNWLYYRNNLNALKDFHLPRWIHTSNHDTLLKALFNIERSGVAPGIADCLATNGTTWHFIPPHSPTFGGLWEAGVKSSKHHLKRVIGTSTLTFVEMTTVLAQIEACLNSRPISAISNPEDPCPLTPGHFLIGEPLVLPPESNYEVSNISSLKLWHLTQRMVQDFWHKWSREYLVQFHHRNKWSHQTVEPNVGDVVLVIEDDLPPARWLYGLIIEKHTGSDKVTRVVSLRCNGSIVKRPVSKLIVLSATS